MTDASNDTGGGKDKPAPVVAAKVDGQQAPATEVKAAPEAPKDVRLERPAKAAEQSAEAADMKNASTGSSGLLPIVISVCALVVSLGSFWNAYQGRIDTAESDAMRKTYDTFLDFDRTQLQQPELSHLFSLADRYQTVCKQVALSVASLSDSQRAALLLRERVLADYIFTIYEHTLYQRSQAARAHDTDRERFLGEVTSYMTGRLLRNPRLLYYWAADGDGLVSQYEPSTVKAYSEGVLHDPKAPLTAKPDSIGPFPLLTPATPAKPATDRGGSLCDPK